jgi:methylisocitrate lyase
MTTPTDRARAFHEIHAAGCFVIPNPWDVGAAKLLAQLGFPALATTSSGFAWSLGKRDNGVTLDEALAHYRAMAAAVEIPVSADFEHGFADSPEGVAANVARACATGLAGLSVEDSSGNPAHPLYDFALAVERVRAAREAIDGTGSNVLLTARAEGFHVGTPSLDDAIARLCAFADAGADCLFMPGLKRAADIRRVVEAVAPKPVNVLVSGDFTTVGGALARAAWAGFFAAAREIADTGTFRALAKATPGAELERAFG